MPKSSIAMRTPSAFIALSRRAVSSTFFMSVVSVISIVRAVGASPLSVSARLDVAEDLI